MGVEANMMAIYNYNKTVDYWLMNTPTVLL